MSLKDLSDYTVISRYAHYIPELKRRETWEEIINRVFGMHEIKYGEELKNNKEFNSDFYFAKEMILKKKVLGSQRALQQGGESILNKNEKIYNCSGLLIDKTKAIQDVMFLLLAGCGVGISVQTHHINKLPSITNRKLGKKTYQIPDTIEGWADSLGVLISSFCSNGATFPEYQGYEVEFDYSIIRKKGSLIAKKFLAPGPDPLKKAIDKIEKLIINRLKESNRFKAINIFDIITISADAVISSGLRRSAIITLFSKEDMEMISSKTGNWYIENPHRGRSNNSVVLDRKTTSKEEFLEIYKSVKEFGEPGFYWVDDDFASICNPCCLSGDTEVFTRFGNRTIKSIVEDIENDNLVEVLSYNVQTAEYEFKDVIHGALIKKSTKVIDVVFQEVGNPSNLYSITVTPDHKFYTVEGGYIEAQDLNGAGNTFIYLNGATKLRFNSIANNSKKIDVYDIEVDENHNFFANGVLVHNCEIGFWPILPSGETGVSFCNLVEINGKFCTTEQNFLDYCKAATIIGTLQAGYNSFPYLGRVTEELAKYESLVGVSLTGWMENPQVLFNEKMLKLGAKICKETNERIAKFIGINPAARLTCCKPSGSSSCILETSSGIHPHHSRKYIRNVQVNKQEFAGQYYKKINPISVEESAWSTNKSDDVISFICEVPKGSILKNDLSAIEFLEKIKLVQNSWVLDGTVRERGLNPTITNNVSNTCVIRNEKEWEDVAEFIYNNRQYFSGISLLSSSGDLDYRQAPFTTVLTDKEIVEKYGKGSLMASGLIVDGITAFDGDLFSACEAVLGTVDLPELSKIEKEPRKPSRRQFKTEKDYSSALINYSIELNLFFQAKGDYTTLSLKHDWVRRAKQFADRYFNGDIKLMTYCLKHVDIWKRYLDISREHKEIDWSKVTETRHELVSADTLGAVACASGACSLTI